MSRFLTATALIICVVSVVGVGMAGADDFLGEFCWQKTPFDDIVKLEISRKGAMGSAHGAQFSSTYSFPFSGTVFIIGNQAIIGGIFVGDLDGSHFNASSALSENAVLSLATGDGPGVMTGIDGKFTPSQTIWTRIGCPIGPTVHDRGGRPERRQGD